MDKLFQKEWKKNIGINQEVREQITKEYPWHYKRLIKHAH